MFFMDTSEPDAINEQSGAAIKQLTLSLWPLSAPHSDDIAIRDKHCGVFELAC